MDDKERILSLENHYAYNHNYYVLDKPTISDFEFDQLLEELIRLESSHPELYDANCQASE